MFAVPLKEQRPRGTILIYHDSAELLVGQQPILMSRFRYSDKTMRRSLLFVDSRLAALFCFAFWRCRAGNMPHFGTCPFCVRSKLRQSESLCNRCSTGCQRFWFSWQLAPC